MFVLSISSLLHVQLPLQYYCEGINGQKIPGIVVKWLIINSDVIGK